MEVSLLLATLAVSVLLFTRADADCDVDQNVLLQLQPDRVQFFDYESFSFRCVGGDSEDGWTVVSNTSLGLQTSQTSDGSLEVKAAYDKHSGDYWCQNASGNRSTATHIIVTGGQVVLEVPALLVIGQDVQLACRSRRDKVTTGYFYKNGRPLGGPSLRSASSSNDGLYSCSISGLGKSPSSRLTFRDVSLCHTDVLTTSPVTSQGATPGLDSASPQTSLPVLIPCLGVAVLLPVAVAAAVAVRRWRKHKGSASASGSAHGFVAIGQRHTSGGLQADVEDESVVIYSAVTVVKQREGRRKPQGPREGEASLRV